MTDASYWNGKGDLLPEAVGSTDSTTSAGLLKHQLWKSPRKGSRGRDSKRLKFSLILLATLLVVCGISGWVGWATTSIRPMSHTVLYLVSTDYHDNDIIQPGLYADRAVGKLAALCSEVADNKSHDNSSFNLRLTTSPIEFLSTDAISAAFPQNESQAFVIYVAAHGVSSSRGPLLLPKDASSLDDGVLLSDLLRLFANYSKETPKTLILDSSSIASDHRWGILHNDFPHQVQLLNAQIQAIPNLTVIVDCDVDQRAWFDPLSGTSVFGEAIIDALREPTVDNAHDGWLDLWDVFLACQTRVTNWTSQHTGFIQSPVLLPLGAEGQRRASRNIFRPTSSSSLPEPPALISASRSEMVDKWWQQFEKLNSRTPHPALTTPLLWDRFVATVLRFEHFEMNGSRAAADWLDDQLESLKIQLDSGRPVESTAARAGLISPLAVGMIPPDDSLQQATAIAEHVMGVDPKSRITAWQQSIKSLNNSYAVAHIRREVVALIVAQVADHLRKSSSIDRATLANAAASIQATQDPLQPTSTLATLFQLLSRDLPANFRDGDDALRLARLLDLWSRCDRVTTPRSLAQLPNEPSILPWVEDRLQAGDSQRRLAFDLMMGDQESRIRADQYLMQAEQVYAQVDDMTKVVAAAQTRLRVGWNQLAWLTATIESRGAMDAGLRGTEEMIQALGKAYSAAEKLADMLASPVDIDQSTQEQTCNTILSLDSQFKLALEEVSGTLSSWQIQDLDSSDLVELASALAVTGGTSVQRRAAWERCRDATLVKNHSSSTTERSINVKRFARLLGKLALASWTESDFNRLAPAKSLSYVQVASQLDIFAVDPDWRNVLNQLGYQIGNRYVNARQILQMPARGVDEIRQNDALARRFDSLLPDEASNTIDRCRNLTALNYLIVNTRRGIADSLASVDQQAMPQFARLSALMVDDISRYAEGEEVKMLHQLVLAAGSLRLQAPTKIDWTTEQAKTVQVDLVRQQDPNPGFVTITAKTSIPVKLLYPRIEERVCRPIRTSERIPDPVLPAMLDSTLLQVALDRASIGTSPQQSANIEVQGYFRGRLLDTNINIAIHSVPSRHFIQPPTELTPRIAVRAPQRPSSVGYGGSIAIVLDCSGSMGSAQGEPYNDSTKYAQAVLAVERIVRELPTGVRLSMWTFGQAGTPNKTVNPAEQSIRRVLAPTIWNPGDSETVGHLINKLTYPASEPWNESPLVASMLAASRDFSGQQDSFRTLVVITDGFDNRIQQDTANNPEGSSAEDVIRNSFSGTDIAVNVIGFRVEQHEAQRTADSLSVVEKLLPPGRYVQVDKAEDLIVALRSCLTRDVQYSIKKTGDEKQDAAKIIVTESPFRGAIRWTDADLEPGSYEVRCITNSANLAPMTSTIELKSGDRLLLQRTTAQDLEVSSNVLRSSQSLGQYRSLGNLDVGLLPIVSTQFDHISRKLLIERKNTRPLAVQPPNDVWIVARDTTSNLPTRWQQDYLAPGTAYQFDIQAVPNGSSSRSVKICLTDSPVVSVGQLIRNRDFKHFADLAPATWQDSAGVVKLTEARIETWNVPDSKGNLNEQSCLVLRLVCPAGSLFRLRPQGIKISGFDEQYFAEANTYTYRAWPVSEADVERTLQSLQLISMNQVTDAAENSGSMLEFQLDAQRGTSVSTDSTMLTQPQT